MGINYGHYKATERTKKVYKGDIAQVSAVYFAKKVITPVFENEDEIIEAKKGETKNEIKARFIKDKKIKKSDFLNYVPQSAFVKAKGGEKITVTYKKKIKDNISFKKVLKAKLKEKLWLVVECRGKFGKISVEVNENKLTNTEAVYESPVKLLVGEEEISNIEFDIATDLTNEPDVYAKEITLQPKNKDDVKALIEKFEKRSETNAFLYFKTESVDSNYEIKFYEETKEFGNKDGERFEISGRPCYCKKNIEVDEIINIIYNLRDKQKLKSKREKFFDNGSEYITSLRISSGKLTDNKEKLKLFVDEMNAMFEKFKINTCKRKIHFIGQMYLETIFFRYTYESRIEVPSNYKGGVDFQGRGMKQITHDYNYLAYYDYVNGTEFSKVYMNNRVGYESVGECVKNRKTANSLGLDYEFYESLKIFGKKLSEELFHAFNSAGWYSTINRKKVIIAMDKGFSDNIIKEVTKEINGGDNGLAERINFTNWTKEYFNYDITCINK